MADGDVVLNERFDIDPIDGTEVVLSAAESSSHPGGYSYGFQYFQPEENDEILRYDNTKVVRHGAGHHRHCDNDQEVTEIEFVDIGDHVDRFLNEVYEINATR
jgi:YHS domain-containing protein